MTGKPQEKAAFRLSLASCVDGIREGWRRMRGEGARKLPDNKPSIQDQGGGFVASSKGKSKVVLDGEVGREMIVRRREKGSQTSFETFLRSLPKLDPVDRTVEWVLAQPDDTMEKEPDRFANLPARGFLLPRPCGVGVERRWAQESRRESVDDEMSLSRYESERGTVGRGTPPIPREGQPRLDVLLLQLHRRQERKTMQRLWLEKGDQLSSYMDNIHAAQMQGYAAGVTADLLPFLDPSLQPYASTGESHNVTDLPTQYHNNIANHLETGHSSNKNQCVVSCEAEAMCEWGECRVTVGSRRQLMTHVAEHIAKEPGSVRAVGQLYCCRWRGCRHIGRPWRSRQTLLQHIHSVHCYSQFGEGDVKQTLTTPQHITTGHVHYTPLTKTRTGRRKVGITRNSTNPKVTMMTGLQIRPALVSRKDESDSIRKCKPSVSTKKSDKM